MAQPAQTAEGNDQAQQSKTSLKSAGLLRHKTLLGARCLNHNQPLAGTLVDALIMMQAAIHPWVQPQQ
jgi:hypothetical protein